MLGMNTGLCPTTLRPALKPEDNRPKEGMGQCGWRQATRIPPSVLPSELASVLPSRLDLVKLVFLCAGVLVVHLDPPWLGKGPVLSSLEHWHLAETFLARLSSLGII